MPGCRAIARALNQANRAGELVGFSFARKELRRFKGGVGLAPGIALTLEDRKARDVSLGGRKGLLVASRHSFPELPKKDRGTLKS